MRGSIPPSSVRSSLLLLSPLRESFPLVTNPLSYAEERIWRRRRRRRGKRKKKRIFGAKEGRKSGASLLEACM